jgi:hypothetical protein
MTDLQQTAIAESDVGSPWERWARIHSELVALLLLAFGFLLRVREAWGTFLTPDEALHFFIANRASVNAVYRASLTQAHPPLLFFVLYALRPFGSSEFILRLPTILTGTLFCWIFFNWLRRLFGPTVGITGLVFAALLPPMVSLTAQVRQYGLLLLFLISAAWLLERALAENSPKVMWFSAVCLWLAMLSHYSALLFTAVLGVYALLRIWRNGTSPRTAIAWVAGQAVAFALAVVLYVTHISKIKGTTMAEQAFDGWLRKSYFHSGDNPVTFLVTRSFSFFQYIFGQLVIGDLVAILFVAGIVYLLRDNVQLSGRKHPLAVLLLAPFLLNYAAALFDLYPYGGTRHCVFLAIFAIAGVAICIVNISGRHAARAMSIALAIVALCWLFRTNHAPYIARADQNRTHMRDAIRFVKDLPASEPIFVDYESGMELGHYLCTQKPIAYEGGVSGFLVFTCAGRRIISTVPDVWAFTPPVFLDQWTGLVGSGYLHPGEAVWVAQAGWMVKLDEDLRKDFPEFRDLKTQDFGNNIRFFRLTAEQPVPTGQKSQNAETAETWRARRESLLF